MGKIDEIDMKILAELVRDANLSVPKLSKKISVNSSVVYSRIKRLIRRQLIRRFTVTVNDELLGYVVSATIGLNIDSKFREKIVEDLMKIDDIREFSEVTGRFDIVVLVKTKSLDELHRLVSGKIGRLEGVSRSETFIELKKTIREPRYSIT